MARLEIKLDSHKTYGTSYEDIILGSFSYTPPYPIIKDIINLVDHYNKIMIENENAKKHTIQVALVNTENYKATLVLKGHLKVLKEFSNKLMSSTHLLDHFDIKIKELII